MKKSYNSIFMLILVMILAISAVSAADIDETSDLTVTEDDSTILEVEGTSGEVQAASDEEVMADSGDGNNFTSLKTLINEASSSLTLNKDYTRVSEDSDIEINKDFTIDGQDTYTIDANNLGGIFKVKNGYTLTLTGVTLINGNSDNGGAVYVENGAALNAENCKFNQNTATQSGGAIYNDGGFVNVKGSTFDGNDLTDRSVNGWGGAAIYDNEGAVIIDECTITNNLKDIVHRGGNGAYTGDLSSAAVTSSGLLTVIDSYFENNSGSYGGAIHSKLNGDLIVSGSTFINNFAFNGGAIDFTGNSYTVMDSTFKGNKAKGTGSSRTNYAHGGAICAIEENEQGVISNCTFEDNAAVMGGAVSTKDTKITNCTFTNNAAFKDYCESFNGKVYSDGGNGAAVYNENEIVIEDSDFKDNTDDMNRSVYVKNADITGSSFDNTVIKVKSKGVVNIVDNTYSNNDGAGKDIDCAGATVNVGEGQIPKMTVGSGKIYYSGTSFTDLQAMIDSGSTGNLYLANDVSKLESEYGTFANGVVIDQDITIFTDGHTITSNNGKVFTVNEGAILTLRNTNIAGDGTAPIVNNGQVTLNVEDTNVFTNAGEYAIDNKGTVYEASLTTFTQLSDLIALVNGGVVNIYTSKITKADSEKEAFGNGIVVEKDLTVCGFVNSKGVISSYIDAANSGRIFSVNDGATLTVENLTLKNGNADYGGAIYVENANALVVRNSELINNTAVYRGGAIYSEGTVDISDSTLKENYISKRDGAGSEHKGGAAIFNNGGTAILDNVQVVDNLKDYVNGNVLDGAVVAMGETTITNSYFSNNYGRYGGAVTQTKTDKTLTVKNTTFDGNTAIFGAAIYDNGATLVVEDSKFYNNEAVGPGSAGTSKSQGGAIVVMNANAAADIKGSEFINNTADLGGAISFTESPDGALTVDDCKFIDNTATDGGAVFSNIKDTTLEISNSDFTDNTATYGGAIISYAEDLEVDNCNFTGNTASYSGGAIESYGTELAVDNCNFTQNTATYGGAISSYSNTAVSNSVFNDNEAQVNTNAMYLYGPGTTLALTNNTIKGNGMQIYASDSILTTPLKVKILDNGTYNAHMSPVTLKATVTDDNDNLIIDYAFRFVVGDKVVDVVPTINTAGLYTATFTPAETGTFVVSSNLEDASEVLTGTLIVGRSLTDLANIIADAETGTTVVLDGDYTYNPEFDADLVEGIVIDKDIAIDGKGYTINGNDLARIFKVTEGSTLTLTNASLVNGNAEYGGAIYVDASNLVLNDCILDSNNVFDLTGSNPNELGGAAIHAVDSTVTIADSYITNNGDRTLDRSNDQVINGAVNLINSNSEITGTLFENNTGIYGGAVFAKGGSLEVSDSKFINNTAYVGAGIRTEGTTLTVTGSKFEENEGKGTGSEGTSKNAGAAICSKGDASILVASSNFTRNSAEIGGAINTNVISSSNTVEIDNCVFTDNVATEKGGAIFSNNNAAETTISNSNFTGNDCVSGSAIYNGGILSLSKNNVDKAGAITSSNVIASNVIITVLDNENATYNMYDKIEDFYAQLTDDNGNVIVTADGILKIGFGTSVISLEYDETDGLYHKADVKVVRSGAPSLPTATKNLFTDVTFEAPYITAIKLNATLEVKYENVTDQDDVVINITLTGKEGESAIRTTTSSIFTVTVNNVPYSVTITTGKGSLTISDLPAGDYVINASWTGNTYYNPIEQLYNLTVGPKKGTFTDLKNLIDKNEDETLVLPYDFTYDEEYDVDLIDGIVIDKDIAIDANGYTIDGNNSARLFKVDAGKTFTLTNASLVNANADSGSAIYNEGTTYLSNSTFTGNVAIDDTVIYNKGTLDETNNIINQDNAIYSTGKITSIVNAVFNDNQDIYCDAFDTIDFTLKFVDDNDNIIRLNVISLRVYVGNKGNPITTLALNKETGIYEGSATALTSGSMHLENEGRWFIDKGYFVNTKFKRTSHSQVYMEKANATLTVAYENITYGEDAVINVTLTGHEGVPLNCDIGFYPAFSIKVGETSKAVKITDGKGSLTVPDLVAGEYAVIVKFNGNNIYNPIEQEYTLKVDKVNVTEFGVITPDTLEGENATVWITLKANETGLNSFVTVIVNNKEYVVSVEDGEGNITIEGLAHGQYPVVAILDDPNYNYLINSSVFFVKGQAKLNVTELTIAEYGDVIEIAINLTDSEGNPLSGIVVVDDSFNVLIDYGTGTFVIDDQPDVGYHSFQAVYDGDNDYFGDLAPFDVKIITKIIDPNDIVVDIPTFNEFGEAIPVTITSPVDGIYTVNINGTAIEVEVVNGTGSVNITLDEPGIYNATVDIDDEGYILETITTDEFEYKTTPEFNVEINGVYPEAEISITGPAGTYHITMDGMEPIEVIRPESGLPTLVTITDMAAGNYTAFVSFDADDEYYGDYKEINFTVNKATSSVTIDPIDNVTYGEDVYISYTVENQTNVVIIVYHADEIIEPEMETADGIVAIKGLTPGDYTIVVKNEESDNYNESFAIGYFTVGKATSSVTIDPIDNVTYGEDVYISYTVENQTNVVIIVYHADEIIEPEMETADGIVAIKGLTPGDYTIVVKNEESDNYNESSAMGYFTVGKAESKVTIDPIDNVVYGEEVFILYTVENQTNVKITVYDNSGPITPEMETVDGIIAIKGLTPGDYQIMIENEESDEYKYSYEMGYFTVAKAASSITILEIEDLVYPGNGEVLYEIENKTEEQLIF